MFLGIPKNRKGVKCSAIKKLSSLQKGLKRILPMLIIESTHCQSIFPFQKCRVLQVYYICLLSCFADCRTMTVTSALKQNASESTDHVAFRTQITDSISSAQSQRPPGNCSCALVNLHARSPLDKCSNNIFPQT